MRYSKSLIAGAAVLLAGIGSANASGFATYFAVVVATGKVAISSGVHSATKTAVGTYIVMFNRNINACAEVASVRSAPGFASVKPSGSESIVVSTFANNGVAVNRAFDVIVSCAP